MSHAMATQRGPLMKQLAKSLQRWPPENFAPWKNPNKRLQKIIDSELRGKLEAAVTESQEVLFSRYIKQVLRKQT